MLRLRGTILLLLLLMKKETKSLDEELVSCDLREQRKVLLMQVKFLPNKFLEKLKMLVSKLFMLS